MRIPYYHIDAFTSQVFAGNPAGVCLLQKWMPDRVLQAVAAENRLSETAFLVAEGMEYALRWFSPETEIDLCGHATLAAAHVLFTHLGLERDRPVHFASQSGKLAVTCRGELYTLDFPARPGAESDIPEALTQALGATPEGVFLARDIMAVFSSRAEIEALQPDFAALAGLDCLGIIVTAPDDPGGADFVSRFFAPGAGIPEDPVTGSAHCTLTPYWAARLGKNELHAHQVSARGGQLFCEMRGERILISGRCVDYLTGTLHLPARPGVRS